MERMKRMDFGIANKLMSKILLLSDQLNEIIHVIEEIDDMKEKKKWRRSIGNVIGIICTDLQLPLIKEYSELNPIKNE